MDLAEATEVFVRAICVGKSAAHPYVSQQFGPVWVMRDGPGRREPRTIKVVACEVEPSLAVSEVRKAGLGWHAISALNSDSGELDTVRASYKALGYRALYTSWMFVHSLHEIPEHRSEPPVRRVETDAEAALIPQLAPQRRKVRGDNRLYGIFDSERDYGWVESVPLGEYGWATSLHVAEDSRRKGYGRALMCRLLMDERERGATGNVLLASTAGSKLYPHLGYEMVRTLQIFTPVMKRERH